MNRKHYIVAAVIAAALGAVAITASGVAAGANTPQSHKKYYPPLFWPAYTGVESTKGGNYKFGIDLNYSGGLNFIYKQLGNKDIIPAVRVTLYLDPGVQVLRKHTHFAVIPFYMRKRVAKKNLRWRLVRGRPTWVYHKLGSSSRYSIVPVWAIVVSATAGQQVCYKAVVKPLRVSHAPVQVFQTCYVPPNQGGTTTTSP